MDAIPTRAELLQQIDRGWTELLAFTASLTDSQLTSPTDAAGWTITDHLLHLADWEAGVCALFRGEDRAAAMGLERSLWESEDYDAQNAVLRTRSRQYGQTRADVMARLNAVHTELLTQLAGLSDADLATRYGQWQPLDDYDHPVVHSIIGNTYEHYAEHIDWMRALAQQP